MAEKPKLKESDEILSSIGKKRGRKQPPPVLPGDVLPGDVLPPPIVQVDPSSGDAGEDTGGGRGRPRKEPAPGSEPAAGQAAPPRPPAPPLEEPAPPPEDRRPLDFGKYELPQSKKRRGRPRKEPVTDAPPPSLFEPAAPPQTPTRRAAAPPETPTAPARAPEKPAILHGGKPEVREFAFEDLEIQRKREEREKAMAAAEEARRAADEARKAADAAAKRAREEEEAAAELARRQAEIEEELARRAAEEEAERQRLEEESRRKLAEDRDYQEDVINKLSDQFEQQFNKIFEGDGEPEPVRGHRETKPWWLEERREGVGKPVRPLPELILDPDEPTTEQKREAMRRRAEAGTPRVRSERLERPDSRPEQSERMPPPPPPIPRTVPSTDAPPVEDSREMEALREAESFLQMFEEEVRSEEEDRQEDFRETLAAKFMRERERYLRDLGIADQMEAQAAQEQPAPVESPAEPAAPPRRKLDFQIQPEMHLPTTDLPRPAGDLSRPASDFSRPVTYTRGGDVQAQEPTSPGTAVPAPPTVGPDGKKSPEQLLMELGVQAKQREGRKAGGKKPAQFNFRFAPVKEPGEGEEPVAKKPRSPQARMLSRVVVLSACVGLVILSVLAYGISRALAPLDNLQLPGETSQAEESGETYTAYENYNPDTVRKYDNVLIKRAGLTLSNLSVQESLAVEEGAAGEGPLTLNNVVVGDYIYIKQSGIDAVELDNVTAKRLIIKNTGQPVTVRASGATDIEVVEIHTPAALVGGDLMAEAVGIRSIQLKNTETAALDVSLQDMALTSVATEGETVVSFTASTVDDMTADGNLSLTGTGRVANLSAGRNAGGGAAGATDAPMAYPVTILIKGVEVGNLNVKSPANVTVSSQVDTIASGDSMNLGGNGTVGVLLLNEKFGNGRLAVDISGVNVVHLTTNAEALVHSAGSAVINKLTANASTYALGNKVNILVANADGVIYENEPDGKQIAQGVNPPQSRADNPNLDYSLTGRPGAPATDTSADAIATTCDHAREVGGYIQGDGSADNPYIVESPVQLAHVSQHPDSHFRQRDDIDIAADSAYADGFPMIGGNGPRFSGVYDGGGYAIRNLRVYSDSDNVGLFAENTGTIRNLHLVSGSVETGGNAFTGALVGFNFQGGMVASCSNGAVVNAPGGVYVGGIVGYNYGGRVRDCYNTGRVTGGDAAGGLVGMNMQGASVTGSYNIGVVEGDSAGAVAGINEAVVTNCYYLDGDDVAGIGTGEGNAIARTAEQLASAQTAADLAAGSDESLWQSSGEGYPSLRSPE